MPGTANASPAAPVKKPTSLVDALWKKLKKLKSAKPKIALNPKHPVSKKIIDHNAALEKQRKALMD